MTGETTTQNRYCITSSKANAETLNMAIRNHRSVENKLHWVLDVNFGEEYSRKRQLNAATNFNIITKVAQTLLAKEKSFKTSYSSKSIKAELNIKFREKILKL
jgi:predicted transposase YbfD/YdcC